MHMADALVSPAVAGTMLAVSAGAIAYSSVKIKKEFDEKMKNSGLDKIIAEDTAKKTDLK